MYALFRPLLFKMDAERAHQLAFRSARFVQAISPSLVQPFFAYENPVLHQKLWNLHFSSPVGLAAGFDKNGQLIKFWSKLGFGYTEVGSVSARSSVGNPKPRMFRLPEDQALINRMGLNNEGAESISKRINRLPLHTLPPLGINLAKTHNPAIMGEKAIDDFARSFELLAPLASYIVLNISCPNTTEGKTFEEPEALNKLLDRIMEARSSMRSPVPLLVKLSPTFSEHVVYDSAIEEVMEIVLTKRIEGVIATNTAPDREGLEKTPESDLYAIGAGGLSGKPLALRTTRLVRYLYEKSMGRLPIIAVGGIDSAEQAYANIKAGASLIQIYSGMVYKGPGIVKRIKKGLVRLLKQDGHSSIRDAIGADVLIELSRSRKKSIDNKEMVVV